MKVFRRLFSEKYIYYFSWILFLYLNLASRLMNKDVNWFYYIVFFVVLGLSLRRFKANWLSLIFCLVSLFFSLFLLDTRVPMGDNIYAFRTYVVPLLAFLAVYFSTVDRKAVLNFLNIIFLPFIAYGVFQAIVFYTMGGLMGVFHILPWDMRYISQILAADTPNNLFQPGGLLRFFGTMNAFIEYQVISVCLVLFLWLNVANLKNKGIFYLNVILLVAFQIMVIERSPLFVAFILIFCWKLPTLIHFVLKNTWVFMLIVVIIIVLLASGVINLSDPRIWGPLNRLEVIFTLNFSADEAILTRSEYLWRVGMERVLDSPLGMGPGWMMQNLRAHNDFLNLAIAYGWFGLLLYILLLLFVFISLRRLENSQRFFGYGLVISYVALAFFNESFAGKLGVFFFLILGELLAKRKPVPESQPEVALESLDGGSQHLERAFSGR